MQKVEIIVPVYNEEEMVKEFFTVVSGIVSDIQGFEFSFLFVDDGSSDKSIEIIKEIVKKHDNVKYISFSRNFGKEAAIYAGLQNSSGDICILMDADLQHPPALIQPMLEAVTKEGFSACGAKREPGFMSKMFNHFNNALSSVKLQRGATDFMCMKREYVEAVLKLSESQRFSKGLFAWVGFKVKWLDYVQNERTKGKSKWNFLKLFSYAMDGVMGFSVVPLRLVTFMGFIICMLAIIYIIITLIRTWIHGIDVPGYVTTLVAILFMGGIILLAIGILGNYIGRIFIESKDRPLYVMQDTNIKKKTNDDK